MTNIKIRLDGKLYPVETFTFSGGEEHVSLKNVPLNSEAEKLGYLTISKANQDRLEIVARLQSSQAIMQFLMVTEVLNRLGPTNMSVTVPYFPYARQDRVTVATEAFSLQGMASLLNVHIYKKILTYDLHSMVAFKYMEENKLEEISQLSIIKKNEELLSFIKEERPILLAPDKGAFDKTAQLAQELDLPFIFAHKKRNPATGEIVETLIPNADLCAGRTVLIPDDICDGGRTFIQLATILRASGAARIALYVTHGIFSRGYDIFSGLIDRIYTTNTFIPKDPTQSHQVPVFIHNIIKE